MHGRERSRCCTLVEAAEEIRSEDRSTNRTSPRQAIVGRWRNRKSCQRSILLEGLPCRHTSHSVQEVNGMVCLIDCWLLRYCSQWHYHPQSGALAESGRSENPEGGGPNA